MTVETRPIALDQLQVPAPRTERRTSVEASTRVDAVASAGFRMSRSKMSDLIKRGDVRWVTTSPTPHCAFIGSCQPPEGWTMLPRVVSCYVNWSHTPL